MGLFRRKIKDPVVGTAEIVRCSMPGNPQAVRSRCHLFVVIDGPGVERTSHELRAQVRVDRWPSSGMTLPCRIDRSRPDRFEIDFDSIPSWQDVARVEAARSAAGERQAPVVLGASSPAQASDAIRTAERALGADLDGDGRIG